MTVNPWTDPGDWVSAIEQLWIWVGEQRHKAVDNLENPEKRYGEMEDSAKLNAYSNVRLYMRKFFAGLIDFDSEEGKTDEELQGNV